MQTGATGSTEDEGSLRAQQSQSTYRNGRSHEMGCEEHCSAVVQTRWMARGTSTLLKMAHADNVGASQSARTEAEW